MSFEEEKVIVRTVPSHNVDLLEDCTIRDLIEIEETIAEAISIGAPLYNEGDHEGCFRKYEATAIALDKKLERSVRVREALLAGVKKASSREGYTFKAWAMRDAFDGVLDVIARKLLADGVLVQAYVPERRVPRHDLTVLKGSSPATIATLETAIGDAIQCGAPIYNDGNAEACFRIYQGTVLSLLRSPLPAGIEAALETGLARAEGASEWEEKAWAMRDTFDGMLDVISRKLGAVLN